MPSFPFAFLALLPLLAPTGFSQEEAPAAEEPAAIELTIPDSPEAALAMNADLDELLEGREPAELVALLEAWIEVAGSQAARLDQALAASEGSPEREDASPLRADLEVLLAGADTIAEQAANRGADVEVARAAIAALRPSSSATLEASTVPRSRQQALELSVDVLKAQLRPLTREQVSNQLDEWIHFLQDTCIEVRDVEVSSLQVDKPERVAEFSARAVTLRGDRAALIKRVEVVIDALETKGGDVEEARAYVNSVVATPPISGLRAAWSTARAWLTDKEGGIAVAKSLVAALAVLAVSWFLSRLLGRVMRRALLSLPKTSELLREFLTSSVRRLTLLAGALIALSMLGVNMTPLVAAIGAAGLVIGLALQGTLGNLASGLMIMVYRPFDVGDAVEVAGILGKVDGMTLMTTAVRTFDNQTIHVPNNKIWGDVITNITANQIRRVDMVFGISYGDDFHRAKEVLEKILRAHDKVLADPAPNVRVNELGDSSVNLICRPWTNTADYWSVYWDVTEEVKQTFDREGLSIPFPQRDVHLIPFPAAEDAGDIVIPKKRPAGSSASSADGPGVDSEVEDDVEDSATR